MNGEFVGGVIVAPFKIALVFFDDPFHAFDAETVRGGVCFGCLQLVPHARGNAVAGVDAGQHIKSVRFVDGQVDFFVFGLFGGVNGGCEISALYEADRKISVSDRQFDLYNDMKGFDAEKDILYAGDEVTVITSDAEFVSWKITDAAGNPVAVEAIEGDVNASRFTFAMPEVDLHIDYVTQYDLDHPEGNEDPESGNAFLDFLVRIINALRKVLQMLANILNLAQ